MNMPKNTQEITRTSDVLVITTHKNILVRIVVLAVALVFSSALLLAPHTANADITTDLMVHWALDEGSGTNAADSSGNGNNGTSESYPNHISWGAGHIGTGAALFDTNDQRINVEDVGTADVLTLSAWIYPNNAGNNDLGKIIQRANTHAFTLCDGVAACASGSNALVFEYIAWDSPGSWYTEADVITMNAWNHVTVTYDRTSAANDPVIYVNGSAVAVYEYATPSGSSYAIPYFIGIGDWGNYFSGRIDDVRYYHRILSAGDVAELYSYTGEAPPPVSLSRPPNNLGLVGYWSFDDGVGTVATDFSGNGNTAILQNNATWTKGRFGNALSIPSSPGSAVVSGTLFNDDTPETFTIAAWVSVEDVNSWGGTLVSIGADRLRLTADDPENSRGTAGFYASNCGFDDDCRAYTGEFLEDTGWRHVAWTFNDNTDMQEMYIDGVLATSTEISALFAGFAGASFDQTCFGAGWNCAGGDNEQLTGSLDDIRIYNRTLGALEIATLARGGAVRVGASSVDLQQGSSLAVGLVGHWTFDGKDTLSTITDRSGGGNNGYFNGGATSSAKTIGVLGQALDFERDANAHRVHIPLYGSLVDGTNDLSMSYWIKLESYQSSGDWASAPEFFGFRGERNFSWTGLETSPYNKLALWIEFTVGGWVNIFAGSPVFDLNTWYHVVAAYDASSGWVIYVNGEVADTDSTFGAIDGPVDDDGIGLYNTFGGTSGTGYVNRHLDGKMDDVRIYNRELTATEVKQLFNLGQVRIQQ